MFSFRTSPTVETISPLEALKSPKLSSSISPPKKKQKGLVQNKLFAWACQYLADKTTLTAESDDEFLNMKKAWAKKLQNLDQLQRVFAENTINDILFEA